MNRFLFRFSALSVMPFWIMMIFFPNWKVTKDVISSPYIVLPPLICYLILLFRNFDSSLIGIFVRSGPTRLSSVLGKPWASTLIWTYAGAFDLFVGRWMFIDSQMLSIPHWLMIFPLFIAIFAGPVGLFLYFVVKLFL